MQKRWLGWKGEVNVEELSRAFVYGLSKPNPTSNRETGPVVIDILQVRCIGQRIEGMGFGWAKWRRNIHKEEKYQ